jgi:hypothetical protein
MKLHLISFLGSIAALALLGINAAQAQSPNSAAQAQSLGSVPAHISGAHAEFTPILTANSTAQAADGSMTHTTALFPVPPIPGHPGVAIVVKSPAFFAHGNFFFPLSSKSRPTKTDDFDLEGAISVSYSQEVIHLLFTQFRVDTTGNVFGRLSVNGQEMAREKFNC